MRNAVRGSSKGYVDRYRLVRLETERCALYAALAGLFLGGKAHRKVVSELSPAEHIQRAENSAYAAAVVNGRRGYHAVGKIAEIGIHSNAAAQRNRLFGFLPGHSDIYCDIACLRNFRVVAGNMRRQSRNHAAYILHSVNGNALSQHNAHVRTAAGAYLQEAVRVDIRYYKSDLVNVRVEHESGRGSVLRGNKRGHISECVALCARRVFAQQFERRTGSLAFCARNSGRSGQQF